MARLETRINSLKTAAHASHNLVLQLTFSRTRPVCLLAATSG